MLYSLFWVIFAQFFVVKGLSFLLLFFRVKAQSFDGLKGLNHNLLTVDGVKAQSSDGLKGLTHNPLECFAHRLGLFGNVLPGYRMASSFPLLDDLLGQWGLPAR